MTRLPDYPITQLLNSRLCERLNADDAPFGAVVLEPHAAGDFREDRVVFAEPRVQARAEPASALADDDRPAGDEVAVVRFHAEPLGVAVAAVARAALSFFMSHSCDLTSNL